MVQLSNAVFAAFIHLTLSAQISTGLPTRPEDVPDSRTLLNDEKEHELFKRAVPAAPFIALGTLFTLAASGAIGACIRKSGRERRCQRPPRSTGIPLQNRRRPEIPASPPPPPYVAVQPDAVPVPPPPAHVRSSNHGPFNRQPSRVGTQNTAHNRQPAHTAPSNDEPPPPPYAPPSYESATAGNAPRTQEPARLPPRKRSDIAGIVKAKKRSEDVKARGRIDDLD
ncbi:hypothetical protein F5887DRAFT_967254 [Amanita rubescens]|nr:hypothetical protein F5887DRAFT_992576 [Amanita rubescens]KAF8345228.1 hypothetical protein F5887DRAFT_967254 [Amanita rubescens]